MILKRTIKDMCMIQCILEHCINLSLPSSDLAVGCGTSDRQIVLKKIEKNLIYLVSFLLQKMHTQYREFYKINVTYILVT